MTTPEKEFPGIRVLGTVAWIVVTNIVGYYGFGDKVTIFQLSMYSSAVLGVFSFFLPNTPPKATVHIVSQILGSMHSNYSKIARSPFSSCHRY